MAEGGFAVVYHGTNEMTGEGVAVKRLLSNDSERKKDAIREASLLRKLDHQNIVKFITGECLFFRPYQIKIGHLEFFSARTHK